MKGNSKKEFSISNLTNIMRSLSTLKKLNLKAAAKALIIQGDILNDLELFINSNGNSQEDIEIINWLKHEVITEVIENKSQSSTVEDCF